MAADKHTDTPSQKKRQVNVMHLVYITVIFIILTILFWTLSLNNSDDALRMFSFASTITSIVLAVVSIVYSIFSGKNVDASLGSISKTSEDIREVGSDIRNIGEDLSKVGTNIQGVAEGIETVNQKLSGEVEKIVGLEDKVHDILSSNAELNERIKALLDTTRQTQSNVEEIGSILSSMQEKDTQPQSTKRKGAEGEKKFQYTVAARLMLYACSLTQKEGNVKTFPLNILLTEKWSLYFYGYAFALNGILGDEIFEVEVKDTDNDPMLTVIRFDSTYFKEITKEDLLGSMDKKQYMEDQLKKIEQYFEEYKGEGEE